MFSLNHKTSEQRSAPTCSTFLLYIFIRPSTSYYISSTILQMINQAENVRLFSNDLYPLPLAKYRFSSSPM